MALKCTVCGKPDPKHFWRCEEHYHCDDCGTREGLCTDTEGVLCDPCHGKRVEKRITEFSEDTEYTAEVTCPWCGHKCSDSWEISDGPRECGDCGREYEVERDVAVTYSTTKRHNVEVTGAARLYRAASGGLPGSAYTRRVATAMHEDLCDVLREHGKNSEMYARQLGKASRVLRRTLPEILEVFVGYSSSSLR